jgi:hypothetical protein
MLNPNPVRRNKNSRPIFSQRAMHKNRLCRSFFQQRKETRQLFIGGRRESTIVVIPIFFSSVMLERFGCAPRKRLSETFPTL